MPGSRADKITKAIVLYNEVRASYAKHHNQMKFKTFKMVEDKKAESLEAWEEIWYNMHEFVLKTDESVKKVADFAKEIELHNKLLASKSSEAIEKNIKELGSKHGIEVIVETKIEGFATKLANKKKIEEAIEKNIKEQGTDEASKSSEATSSSGSQEQGSKHGIEEIEETKIEGFATKLAKKRKIEEAIEKNIKEKEIDEDVEESQS